uniref:Cytochrome c oxidase subunit 2 n=1 Tax=Inconeuria sp. BYU_PL154 TaxID=466711 RepID=A9XS40_9NEOP|nr:cytochrome oxidase subunit II [Inconeuria sp. BYU_PL154]
MATWANLSFQDSASPLMEQLSFFHDHSLLILAMITAIVSYLMMTLLTNHVISRFLLQGQLLEVVWTILPAMTLIFIALPSLRLLYLLDEVSTPAITLKAIGHQWYWSYEYSDFQQVEFDSYMMPYHEMNNDGFRLLDVDNRAVVPLNSQVRILVTAADVLHSWTVPCLGVKLDATPGRLNQASFLITRPGLYFGQCSEICGANHSFMPIVLETVPAKTFIKWIASFKE